MCMCVPIADNWNNIEIILLFQISKELILEIKIIKLKVKLSVLHFKIIIIQIEIILK